MVVANDIRLQHVFLNLLLNAVQQMAKMSSRQGCLTISAETANIDGRPWIRVRFADNGPGIHRRQWDTVFAFGFTTRPEGSGLGLYIARSLIESIGGRIRVEESRMLLGSTFVVELPVARTP
jgi:signal transduction histidine kinase